MKWLTISWIFKQKFQGGVPLVDYHKLVDLDQDDSEDKLSYKTGPTTEMVSRIWTQRPHRTQVSLRRIPMDEVSSDMLLKEEQRNLRQLRLCHPGKSI